ncbi:hypothetical protein CERZMDRAFT_97285 [Cercospora zeae-maydis SCOH1-5]|uniref:Uncharacterized protein n=1 Tax=Cercospora zeae-maydis SCOH1-5 TaxID=717836 RepID=A0A6A6FH48_9PEZI|nr:hypothetical protein CERZMDRAFT_97285 [Cercospora zeae-maydis SCOH1-5]
MSHSWLTRTPHQLLNNHSKTHNVKFKDLVVTAYIIDSKKVFLLRDSKGRYGTPEYRFAPPPSPRQETMEHYAFKLMQPFIESHLLHQIRFVDLAFDIPLIQSHPNTSPNTLHLSLIITATDGCSITASWIQQTMAPFTNFDFIDFPSLPNFLLSSTHLLATKTAITRHKNLVPRLKNILGAGVAETPAFRTFCIKSLSSKIRAIELRERKTLEKGYICVFGEYGKLYLLPVSEGEILGQKKTQLRRGEEWEVIGKWRKSDREEFSPGNVRFGGDLLRVWWSGFGADGAMLVGFVEGGVGEEGVWGAGRWREDDEDGEDGDGSDGVPRWVRENGDVWGLQDWGGD